MRHLFLLLLLPGILLGASCARSTPLQRTCAAGREHLEGER
jgi:hypothetical protein